ncbi:MAG TPA: hypothetical protein VNM69_00345 [Bacillus sp. (in: firmicutes)]|uniref:hypothetical protein n=1 Tax=Bacillus litorisediminis TaxID=2922713 RepID=UPI001FAE3102|nr:hypothetical protein [Bacillus litorisediminis]HWO74345.1 hypothetical protein [Bacillus sp. (in: firmicutes)]
MKQKTLLVWSISAILYLGVVIGAYSVYASMNPITNNHQEDHTQPHTDDESSHSEHNAKATEGNSDIQTNLEVKDSKLSIAIKDKTGELFDELEVNHEKLLHLIIISSDMELYKHLHPEKIGAGMFEVNQELPDGEYKAFIDIKPIGKTYQVNPISFTIGENHRGDHQYATLKPSESMTVKKDKYQVTMNPSSLNVNEEIKLSFDLNGTKPEQYLGALGHVVILDEAANEYIHVHPLKGEEPVFATSFDQPGLYKVWAEFKFNGDVFVFPYVIEIDK